MKRFSLRNLLLVGTGLLLALILAAIPAPPQPTNYPDFWVRSPSPTGTKAFYSLLDKHYAAGIWQNPIQMLSPEGRRELMIIIEPSREISVAESERWQSWIEKGNTLWLWAENPEAVLPLAASPTAEAETEAGAGAEDGWDGQNSVNENDSLTGFGVLAGVYDLKTANEHRLQPAAEDQILLADAQGAVAYARTYGDGELVVGLAPEWLQNGQIGKSDQLRVLLLLLERNAPQVVWFDEYYHGFTSDTAFWQVFPMWLLMLGAGGCLWLGLELWRRGMRFGAAEKPRQTQVRFGDERIQALAAWFERKKFYSESLRIQIEFLQQLLSEKWGVSGVADADRLQAILQRRLPAQEVDAWLAAYRTISANDWPQPLPPRDYVLWSRRLSKMQREVHL